MQKFFDEKKLTMNFWFRRRSAMCFASGSIFGNKFLTPGGIKTLFPIFENSLVYKELAEKTQWPLGNQK